MALTKACASVTDWTALASGVVAVAAEIDVHLAYKTLIHIEAFGTTDNTVHAGTEFIIQGRSNDSTSYEDWYDICRFVDLVGTPQLIQLNEDVAVDEPEWGVDENPTSAVTGLTTGKTDGPLPWVGVLDANTIANCQTIMVVEATDNAAGPITVLNNTANTYDTADSVIAVAMSRGIPIDIEHYYVRVVINNNYDVNGSAINYRIRSILTTAL
jgi:hypothetical protein